MPILEIIFILLILGVVLYVINSVIPMESWVKKLINIIIALVVIIWLLQVTGVLGPLSEIRVR